MCHFKTVFVLVALMLLPALAWAQSPPLVPVEGALSDTAGAPVTGTLSVAFTVYGDAAGAAEVWSSTRDVSFDSGRFAVLLGEEQPFDLSIFRDYQELYLGIAVGGDSQMDLVRIGTAPYAGFARYCGDADTVGGSTSTELLGNVQQLVDQGVHDRYTDAEAVLAMGDKAQSNTLNHDRFTASEAVSAMGASSPTNTLNHERYTDADAVSAVATAAAISTSCPSDTTRMGYYCIDNTKRTAAPHGNARTDCHDEGKMVCPLEALMLCDTVQPTTSDCHPSTDNGTEIIWTGDSRPVNGQDIFAAMLAYRGNNLAMIAPQASSYGYFCCSLAL